MAKIVEAHFEESDILHSEGLRIPVERPKRRGGFVWAAVFAVMLASGAMIGLGLANGAFSNAVQVTQNAFSADETSGTVTN